MKPDVSIYPNATVELVVPFPPGGVTDIAAQAVAKFLAEKWQRRIAVTHVPGEGGATGTMRVLRSPSDGHTMLMNATGQATQNPAIKRDLPYRWDQTTPVARVVASPLVFVVRGGSQWNGLREVMADVSKNPANYKYGTSGVGGIGSIAIARLLDAAGIDPKLVGRAVMHGGAAMLDAVVRGETHFAVQYLAEMQALLGSGSIKPLAVSGRERVRLLPGVPCGSEAGFDAFDLMGWSGVAGPEGLAAHVVRKWGAGLRELTGNAQFQAQMAALGGTAAYLGPAEFKAAMAAEYAAALQFAAKLGLNRS